MNLKLICLTLIQKNPLAYFAKVSCISQRGLDMDLKIALVGCVISLFTSAVYAEGTYLIESTGEVGQIGEIVVQYSPGTNGGRQVVFNLQSGSLAGKHRVYFNYMKEESADQLKKALESGEAQLLLRNQNDYNPVIQYSNVNAKATYKIRSTGRSGNIGKIDMRAYSHPNNGITLILNFTSGPLIGNHRVILIPFEWDIAKKIYLHPLERGRSLILENEYDIRPRIDL